MFGFLVIIKGLLWFIDVVEFCVVIDGLVDGLVDIVIGIYWLLQIGVCWKDLGLVVVDEEQWFGVEYKEYIKLLCIYVDVLIMSVILILCMLEMSLVGICEMLIILMLFEECYLVLIYVGLYDDKQIVVVLCWELLCDGQVFYVYNWVSLIDVVVVWVCELVFEVWVVVVYGQMFEDLLEIIV